MLTPEVLARAIGMRSYPTPIGWRTIGRILNCSIFALRAEIEPGYLEQQREYSRRYRALGYKVEPEVDLPPPPSTPRPRESHRTGHQVHSVISHRISVEAEAIRRRNADYEPESVTAYVMGDPPPWRSALGKARNLRK